MQRIFIGLIFVFVLFMAGNREGIACSCGQGIPPSAIPNEDFTNWLKNSESPFFEGRVVSVKSVYVSGKAKTSIRMNRVVMNVDRTWKYLRTKTVIFYTPINGAACGYSYRIGEKYLINPVIVERKLFTGLCTQIHLDKYRQEYLEKLSKIKS